MTASNRLYLHRITYAGLRGADEPVTLDFDPGFTVIAGPNGSGKSSAYDAAMLLLGLEAKGLASLRHVRADGTVSKVEIDGWLRNEDGSREIHIRRRAGGTDVRDRMGESVRVVQRPVEFIRDLVDRSAAAESFVDGTVEEQMLLILETLTLTYSRDEALIQSGAAALRDFRLPVLPEGLGPLDELERIEKAVYDERTGVNTTRQRKKDLADGLLAGLPAQAPGDVAAELAEVDGRCNTLAADLARREASIDTAEREKLHSAGIACEAALVGLMADHNQAAAELRARAEKRIAELDAEMRVAMDAHRTACENEKATARAASLLAREGLTAGQGELAEAREYLAALRERHTRAAGDKEQRTKADEAQALAAQYAARAEELTAALDGLKRYKLRLAESLPIPGLRLVFGQKGERVTRTLTLDSVPLEQVNRARLAEIAGEVALLRAKAPENDRPYLPILLYDDAEKFDPAARRAMEARAKDVQIIATVVSAGTLAVLHGQEALA